MALCQIAHDEKENSIKTLNKIQDVYCVLPDDGDELSSMMKFDDLWYILLPRVTFYGNINTYKNLKDLFNCVFNDGYCILRDFPEAKDFLWRRLTTLQSCGGITSNVKQFEDNNKRAMRKILQEDFDSFKDEVVRHLEHIKML